jgi:predicted aminopeptidase
LKKRLWVFLVALLALFAVTLTGCQTVKYCAQAISGQCQMVNRQRPIREVVADAQTPQPLRDKLQLVLKLREFAQTNLHLETGGHYLNYADLGRRFAVWNVYAAPEFSLEAKSWWYPVVGRLKYQGYFNEAAALRYGTNLAERGFDVFEGGVEAYSTLGWFRDPVLNTFIKNREDDLAELLFHELAHQRLFIPGDTDFNEAFATAVAEEGLRRWILAARTGEAYGKYESENHRKQQFLQLLTTTKERLEVLYGESSVISSPDEHPPEGLSANEKRRQKERIFDRLRLEYAELKAQWGGLNDYDDWFQKPINNARISTVETYYKLVPAFHQLLRVHNGDLEKFYKAVGTFGKLKEEERHRRLLNLLPKATIMAEQ